MLGTLCLSQPTAILIDFMECGAILGIGILVVFSLKLAFITLLEKYS